MGRSQLNSFLFRKFFFSRQGNRYFSVVAVFAILGFVLGVCALIVVMSIMKGFEHQITSKLHTISADYILAFDHRPSQDTLSALHSSLSPQQHMLLTTPLKGFINNEVLGENAVDIQLMDTSFYNRLKPFFMDKDVGYTPIVGSETSKRLFLPPGTTLTVTIPSLSEDPLGMIPKQITFSLGGRVKTGVYSIDEYSIFLPDTVLSLKEIPSRWYHEIHLFGKFHSSQISAIEKITHPLSVKSWEDQNKILLFALRLEQITMNVFLWLIISVALSSIVSLLSIFFADRKKALSVLMCLGYSPQKIRNMLTSFGLTIGLVGSMLGILLAAGVLTYIHFTDTFQLPHIYYQRNFPIQVDPIFILLVVVCSLAACYGVSYWISRKLLQASLLEHLGEDPIV